jgi:hypothetical protein
LTGYKVAAQYLKQRQKVKNIHAMKKWAPYSIFQGVCCNRKQNWLANEQLVTALLGV